jgi:hypothetical protein
MKSNSSLLCPQKHFSSSTPLIYVIHCHTIHLSMSQYPKCSAPLLSGQTFICAATPPLHATCCLFTQSTVLTEDNWCSIVCRLKNPCCSLQKTVPQELDPVHTVPAHRGMHCNINTANCLPHDYVGHHPLSEVQFMCNVRVTVQHSNGAPPEHKKKKKTACAPACAHRVG